MYIYIYRDILCICIYIYRDILCICIYIYHLYVDNVQNHIDGTCITVHILKFDQPFKPSFWDNSYPNELTYYRSWITAQTLGPFIQWPWKISLQWFLTKQKGLEYALETWHGTQQRRSPRGFSRRPIDFAKFGMCFQRCHFAFENSLGFWAQLSNHPSGPTISSHETYNFLALRISPWGRCFATPTCKGSNKHWYVVNIKYPNHSYLLTCFHVLNLIKSKVITSVSKIWCTDTDMQRLEKEQSGQDLSALYFWVTLVAVFLPSLCQIHWSSWQNLGFVFWSNLAMEKNCCCLKWGFRIERSLIEILRER